MKVKEICDYSGSTLLGMNGGMVESPDSKRIIYARKADLTKSVSYTHLTLPTICSV